VVGTHRWPGELPLGRPSGPRPGTVHARASAWMTSTARAPAPT